MARPRRIDLPFCLYHVLSRTNTGDVAFLDVWDERKFFHYVSKYAELFSFRIHAFCLMPTHFHLLMESTERASLSEFMRRLLTAYTIYFNRRQRRHGHLFQGRFKSYVVDKATYLFALSRYIHLNPKQPEHYRGSSLRYYIKGGEPPFLYTSEILSWFKGSREKYVEFVREGLSEKSKPEIAKQRFIGTDDFVLRMVKRLDQKNQPGAKAQKAGGKVKALLEDKDQEKANDLVKIVSQFFHLSPQTVRNAKYSKKEAAKARAILVALLHEFLPWTCSQIADYVRLKGNSSVCYHLNKIKTDRSAQSFLEKTRKKISSKLNKL